MHRHRVRAFVTGTGETDVPVAIFAAGQYVRFVSGVLLTTSLGPGTTVVNALATWGDTTGTSLLLTPVLLDNAGNMTALVTLDGQDAPNITAKIGADPAVGEITVWASATAPWKLGRRQVTVNTTGDVDNVNTLNGRSPGILVGKSPTSTPAATSVMVHKDTTGIVSDATPVLIDSSGNLTNVGTINGTTIGNWVQGPSSSTDATLASWDGATGKLLRSVTVITVSGTQIRNVGLLNSITVGENSIGATSGVLTLNAINSMAVGFTTFSGVTAINSRDPNKWVEGPASSVATHIATYADTTGKVIEDVSNITATGGSLAGVTSLNSLTVPTNLWVRGPTSSTVNRVAVWNSTDGRLITDCPVSISATGAITGVSTLNSVDPATWVVGPASSTTNAITLYNGTTGKLIKNSVVLVDGSGNISSAGTYNGVDVANHALRHTPGGGDTIINTSTNWALGDAVTWAGSSAYYIPQHQFVGYCSSATVGSGAFVTPSGANYTLPNRTGVAKVSWVFGLSLGDVTADIIVSVSWSNGTGTWYATMGAGSSYAGSGATITIPGLTGAPPTPVLRVDACVSTGTSCAFTFSLKSGGAGFTVNSAGSIAVMFND